MNEAAFDLPQGFVDRTVTVLEAATEDGEGVSIIVERSPLPRGQSLQQATKERLLTARKDVRGFSILYERDCEVARTKAIDVGTKWRDDDGIVYTRSIHLALGDMLLIIAGEAGFEDRETCDRVLDHVAGSLRPIE